MEPLDASMFVDPENHQPVTRATDSDLARIRDAIAAGDARRADGGPPPESVDGGYVSSDGAWLYPDVDGIASFLLDARLALPSS